jgi:circadian clock protein KaiB
MESVGEGVAPEDARVTLDALEDPDRDVWYLRLYVAGQSPRSLNAKLNLQRLCDRYLPGRYRIETIDLVKNPALARDDDVLAIPTLVRLVPPPQRKLIGDLSRPDGISSFFTAADARQHAATR